MELAQLDAFIAAADCGSFSRAAELLNVKTSAQALPAEESEALRKNFFANMRAMLE